MSLWGGQVVHPSNQDEPTFQINLLPGNYDHSCNNEKQHDSTGFCNTEILL